MRLTTADLKKLQRYGLKRLNSPKLTPRHDTKKAIVAIRDPRSNNVRIIRFGAQGYGHNYSAEARKSFKSRHAKNIARGKVSAAYWANKFLWGGPKARKKQPPKRRS